MATTSGALAVHSSEDDGADDHLTPVEPGRAGTGAAALEGPSGARANRLAISTPAGEARVMELRRFDHVGVSVVDVDNTARLLGDGLELQLTVGGFPFVASDE